MCVARPSSPQQPLPGVTRNSSARAGRRRRLVRQFRPHLRRCLPPSITIRARPRGLRSQSPCLCDQMAEEAAVRGRRLRGLSVRRGVSCQHPARNSFPGRTATRPPWLRLPVAHRQSQTSASRCRHWLDARQNADGGWAYPGPGAISDTNSTAISLGALKLVRNSEKGGYLRSVQRRCGAPQATARRDGLRHRREPSTTTRHRRPRGLSAAEWPAQARANRRSSPEAGARPRRHPPKGPRSAASTSDSRLSRGLAVRRRFPRAPITQGLRRRPSLWQTQELGAPPIRDDPLSSAFCQTWVTASGFPGSLALLILVADSTGTMRVTSGA